MKKATVKAVYKNIRYRLIETSDGEYYLLDAETYIWDKVFPILMLCLPRKAYPITEDEHNRLLIAVKSFEFDDKELKKFPVFPLSILLTSIIPINFLALSSAWLNQLYVLLCFIGVLIVQCYARSNKALITLIRQREPVWYQLKGKKGHFKKAVRDFFLALFVLLMFGIPIVTNVLANILFYVMFAFSLLAYTGVSTGIIPYNSTFYLKKIQD